MTYLYVVGAVVFVLAWAWFLYGLHLAHKVFIGNLMYKRKKEIERLGELKEQIKSLEYRQKVLRALERLQ